MPKFIRISDDINRSNLSVGDTKGKHRDWCIGGKYQNALCGIDLFESELCVGRDIRLDPEEEPGNPL